MHVWEFKILFLKFLSIFKKVLTMLGQINLQIKGAYCTFRLTSLPNTVLDVGRRNRTPG
jgi:hypothetical protein